MLDEFQRAYPPARIVKQFKDPSTNEQEDALIDENQDEQAAVLFVSLICFRSCLHSKRLLLKVSSRWRTKWRRR